MTSENPRRRVVPFLVWTGGAILLAAGLPAAAANGEADHDEVIVLHQGQSKLIPAPWPVKRVAVTDPETADVEGITPDRLLILGRKVGTTDLFLWGENEAIWRAQLKVLVDLERFKRELAELFPGAQLGVEQSQNVVVVTGSAASTEQVDRLDDFLKASEAATGLEHVNLTGATAAPIDAPSNDYTTILNRELDYLFPDCDLRVRQSQEIIVVTGLLRRLEQVQQLDAYLKALQEPYEAALERWGSEGLLVTESEDTLSEFHQRRELRFVNLTSLAGVQQVMLHVRVAEASRQSIRQLGINILQTGHHDGTFFGFSQPGSSTGGALNPVSIAPPAGAPAGGTDVPFVFNADVNVNPLTTLVLGFPRADLQFFIQALSENSYLRILAEPKLVALSGEEANFLAGGEYPIPVVQGGTLGGSTSVTIEYKEYGVRLRFRPTVQGDNTIRLHVAPEVSDLSDQGAVEIQGFRIPAIITRRSETTLEIRSGQTFMMAGLLNNFTRARNSRTPGLGDVPVIGALFRSVRYEQGETELVILVTADLIEPMNVAASDLPVPGDLHTAPDDWELYGMGQLDSNTPPKLSSAEIAWLEKLGLNQLVGPGAWATIEQGATTSEAEVVPISMAPAGR